MFGSSLNSLGRLVSRKIKKNIARKAAAKRNRRLETTRKLGNVTNLLDNSGEDSNFGVFDAVRAEAKTALDRVNSGSIGELGATKKESINNLLRANSQREQQVRAKKAAPGFSTRKSMIG